MVNARQPSLLSNENASSPPGKGRKLSAMTGMRTFGVLAILLLIAAGDGSAAEDPATVQSLVETLRGHDPVIAGWAAMALGRLGEKGVSGVPVLIEALSDQRPIEKLPFAAAPVDEDPADDVDQDDVVEALGWIGKSARPAIPAIEDWARRQAIPVWREKASEAIERIRSADRP